MFGFPTVEPSSGQTDVFVKLVGHSDLLCLLPSISIIINRHTLSRHGIFAPDYPLQHPGGSDLIMHLVWWVNKWLN